MRTCLCHGAGPGPRSAQPRKQTLPEGWEHRLGRASESRVRVRAGPGRPGRLHCTAGVSTRGASGCEGRHTPTRARARIHTAGKAVASGCDGRAPAAERPKRNRGGRENPWNRLLGVCRGEHRMMLRIRWHSRHRLRRNRHRVHLLFGQLAAAGCLLQRGALCHVRGINSGGTGPVERRV